MSADKQSLDGRRIVVTGASSGIGRRLFQSYAGAGALVVGVARRASALRETLRGTEADDAHVVAADLTTDEGRSALAAACAEIAPVDVVVHAAGALGPRVPLAEYPDDAWHSVFDVNVTAVHKTHRSLLPHLSPTATIIGVSSSVGRTGRGTWGMYSISKGALENWLEVLADEWGGMVFSVNPGGTATPMRAEAVPEEDPTTIPSPKDIMPIFMQLARKQPGHESGAKLNARDFIDTPAL